MATLYVREIPDKLYQRLRLIAGAQGRSLSSYVLTLLEQAVDEEQKRRAQSESLSSIRHRRRALPSEAPDSVVMLRQIRGEDGQ